MILDSLNGLERYFFVHPRFEKVYSFLKSQNLETIEVGRYEVDGDNIFVLVSEGEGKQPEDAKLEAHDSYIDIQLLLDGEETMGWKDRSACYDKDVIYNAEKDIVFFEDEPDTYFTLEPLHVAIFFPHDAHAPMIGESKIKKAVVKVRL